MAAISEETGLPVRVHRYPQLLRWGFRMLTLIAIAIAAALVIHLFASGVWS